METTQILSTKLYLPQTRPGLVLRERLKAQLDDGLKRKLTLVSAPAGFGKTTLISEWSTHCARPIAWLTLDERDNDPLRFLTYLLTALRSIKPDLGQNLLENLQLTEQIHIQALLTELINQLNTMQDFPGLEHPVEEGYLLILDDYHFITNQSVHDALTFFIENQPEYLHTIIITRADPPIPIARMRGRGQLTELRQGELSFTLGESIGFFNQVMDLNIPPDDVSALNIRTEGWVAGLQMAGLALQARLSRGSNTELVGDRNSEITNFIDAFTGSNRFILDYLVEEVLAQQPEYIQIFLLSTSILDRLSGSLCDALLEEIPGKNLDGVHLEESSDQILDYLERSNLFVVPLDDNREWYRYHQLFADLLKKRLESEYRVMVPVLHRRASQWFEAEKHIPPAIDHALIAQDYQRAAHLIEETAEAVFKHSEISTFVGWMDELPEELVRSNPSLSFYYSWALLINGRPINEVQEHLMDADVEDDAISARIAAIRSYIAAFQGNEVLAAEYAQFAIDNLAEDDTFMRSIATWTMGISYSLRGDMNTGNRTLEEAIRLSQRAGNLMTAVMGLCTFAETRMSQARLFEAKAIYGQALSLATDDSGAHLPIAGMVLIGLGELSREWNELDRAEKSVEEGIDLIRQQGEIGTLDGYITLARIRQAQGDNLGASDVLQQAEQLAIQLDFTEFDDFMVDAHRVRLMAMQGDLEATYRILDTWERWSTGKTSEGIGVDNYINKEVRRYMQILRARVLVAQGDGMEALSMLEPQLSLVESQGKVRRSIEILNIMSKAYRLIGDEGKALAALGKALERAEPSGYMRIFLDEGDQMYELLRRALKIGEKTDYIKRLLVAFDGEAQWTGRTFQPVISSLRQPRYDETGVLLEPLTERELDVLRMLPSHLTIPEIASELYIATSTVRSHIKNIYSKLGVHNRGEAISKAKELNYM